MPGVLVVELQNWTQNLLTVFVLALSDIKPSIIGKKKPMAAKKGVSQIVTIFTNTYYYHNKK